MSMKTRLCAFLCAVMLAAPAAAQPFPSRPVHVIVPQTPGGATDVFARLVSQKLSEKWGQSVVVENKAGAAGVVGTDVVAKSAPDGYTLLLTYAGSQAVNQSLYAKLPFDSVEDFQTVTTVAVTPFLLVVGPKSKVKDLKELIAAARKDPEAITYASPGSGSVNHLLAEMLKSEAKINLTHVPYKGIAAGIADIVAGRVDMAFTSLPSVIGHVRSGQLRAIAVSSAKRNDAAPDVPTVAEQGIPGFDVSPWWGILAPAGTPRPIVDKINADVAEVLKTPEMQAKFKDQGGEIFLTTPDAFLKLLESDVVKWGKVVKASGARVD
jgi:tripartite-type tricarboxylate transporter receptor subunit TctC